MAAETTTTLVEDSRPFVVPKPSQLRRQVFAARDRQTWSAVGRAAVLKRAERRRWLLLSDEADGLFSMGCITGLVADPPAVIRWALPLGSPAAWVGRFRLGIATGSTLFSGSELERPAT